MQNLTKRLTTSASHETCQSGDYSFGLYPDSVTMDNTYRHTINFQQPFQTPPAVVIGTTLIDVPAEGVIRMVTRILSVTKEGFAITFETWNSSKMFGAGIYWMACPTS